MLRGVAIVRELQGALPASPRRAAYRSCGRRPEHRRTRPRRGLPVGGPLERLRQANPATPRGLSPPPSWTSPSSWPCRLSPALQRAGCAAARRWASGCDFW